MIGEELQPTDEQIRRLRERERASAAADVHFDLCPTCAFAIWRCTYHEGTGRTIVTLGEDTCENCVEFRRLHPAVFLFVLRALSARDVVREMADRAKAVQLHGTAQNHDADSGKAER